MNFYPDYNARHPKSMILSPNFFNAVNERMINDLTPQQPNERQQRFNERNERIQDLCFDNAERVLKSSSGEPLATDRRMEFTPYSYSSINSMNPIIPNNLGLNPYQGNSQYFNNENVTREYGPRNSMHTQTFSRNCNEEIFDSPRNMYASNPGRYQENSSKDNERLANFNSRESVHSDIQENGSTHLKSQFQDEKHFIPGSSPRSKNNLRSDESLGSKCKQIQSRYNEEEKFSLDHSRETHLNDKFNSLNIGKSNLNSGKLSRSYSNYGRYENDFEEISKLGEGGFGSVFKVRRKNEGLFYAVKKIELKGETYESLLKKTDEYKKLAQLDSIYTVQHKSSWIEEGLNCQVLYIQMELCDSTLEEIIELLLKEMDLTKLKKLSTLGYYIASELFGEILEGVDFLHKKKIIHRDLKPQNILISYRINGKFAKISDFGIATCHGSDNQTHTVGVGTSKYIAPEVKSGREYDEKADIYSLGFIAEELFNLDINSSQIQVIEDNLLMQKYQSIEEIILKMMENRFKSRPDCEELIKSKNQWSLSLKDIENDKALKEIQSISPKQSTNQKKFHHYFLQKKLEANRLK